MRLKEDWKPAVLGFAVGDALGVPVEFKSRSFLHSHPVSSMQGYGSHAVPKGTWSDDTSMILATIDSLLNGLDYRDMMERFCSWGNDAEYTPFHEVFDMGVAIRRALLRYISGEAEPILCGGKEEKDNGNGSLMRILPAIFYCKACFSPSLFFTKGLEMIHTTSALTHAHPRSQMACGIYACIVSSLLDSHKKESVAEGLTNAFNYYKASDRFRAEAVHFGRLLHEDFAKLPETDIRSSGYVVNTLEAAVWSFLSTDSFESCVLKAVNLGDDTDTVAAIAGALAGILYGLDAIPKEWLSTLVERQYIENLCDQFASKIFR